MFFKQLVHAACVVIVITHWFYAPEDARLPHVCGSAYGVLAVTAGGQHVLTAAVPGCVYPCQHAHSAAEVTGHAAEVW
jgi:hypothetical protein